MNRIPVAGPWITQKEIDYVTDAVSNAWYGNHNVYHARFEQAFADYLGVRYAMTLPSCTSAIHLALAALGLAPGDEVIVPDITWIATSAPISYMGATPVFADVDLQTWCLSVESFQKNITPRTKAVIPVDIYGNMPEMSAIRAISNRYGIAVVEDAAQAIGSEFEGKKAGSFGDAGVFSFHGSKTLTTGEGGMLVTDDEELYRCALVLRDHGRAAGDKQFWNDQIAYKYKMSSMQAAFGLAQTERIEELVAHKRQIFAWYEDALSGLDGVTLNYEAPDTKNTYWMITVIVDPALGIEKEQLMALLGERDIDTRPFFYPLSMLPAYENSKQAQLAQKDNQIAYQISPYGVNFPSALSLTEEQVNYVCGVLRDLL